MSDIAALLQEISSRLANIEKKIGLASSDVDANERNPLAADFENVIIKGQLPKLIEAFNKLGDDGVKIVSLNGVPYLFSALSNTTSLLIVFQHYSPTFSSPNLILFWKSSTCPTRFKSQMIK